MKTIKETENDRCVDIGVTRDCSYFLTEKYDENKQRKKRTQTNLQCFRGALWSCGLNNYHQLGHPGVSKLLVPTKVDRYRSIETN